MWLTGVMAMLMLCAHAVAQNTLPPAADLLPPADHLSLQPTLTVSRFQFEGNTVYSDDELAAVIADYIGRPITSEELHEARRAVTVHYINHGFINSGAVLPDQTVVDGVVVLHVVEGELTDLIIRGNKYTRTDYLLPRVRRAAGEPLNAVQLKQGLETLLLSPNFATISGELSAGDRAGQSRLLVDVTENDPLFVGLQFINDRAPSVGAERLNLLVRHMNVTGREDVFNLKYGILNGGFKEMDFAEDDEIDVSYTFPITEADTALTFGYRRSDNLLVEEPFIDLDVSSESEYFLVGVRQPIYRTPNTEVALAVTAERRKNETFLFGIPFSFSPGAEDGRTVVSVIRFSQEFLHREARHIVAARSTVSFGIDALDSTIHSDLPDSQFVSWLGQAQYTRKLFDTENLLIVRGTTQIADDSLLPLEQFAVGGIYSVRGYRENSLVRDSGVIATVEFRVPLIMDSTGKTLFEVAPFYDFGQAWNKHDPTGRMDFSSAGVGLLLHLQERLEARVYWGVPLRQGFDGSDHNLQDDGIHFEVVLQLN